MRKKSNVVRKITYLVCFYKKNSIECGAGLQPPRTLESVCFGLWGVIF